MLLALAGTFKYGLEVEMQLRSLLFTNVPDFFYDRIMPLGHLGLLIILRVCI